MTTNSAMWEKRNFVAPPPAPYQNMYVRKQKQDGPNVKQPMLNPVAGRHCANFPRCCLPSRRLRWHCQKGVRRFSKWLTVDYCIEMTWNLKCQKRWSYCRSYFRPGGSVVVFARMNVYVMYSDSHYIAFLDRVVGLESAAAQLGSKGRCQSMRWW